MTTLTLKVLNCERTIEYMNQGENEVALVCNREYVEGDLIIVSSSNYPVHLMIQVDDGLGEALVYMTRQDVEFIIPKGEKSKCYSSKAFSGKLHVLTARVATMEEIYSYRNLAKNVMDQHDFTGLYPHISANVETRGEAIFAARNVIDGVKMNQSHGEWPYQSWGINRQEDAKIQLDFGRNVIIDRIVLYTRADFPHDNWWKQVNVTFSDNTSIVWTMEKSTLPHVKNIEKKEISWLCLSDLIKADDPSPFPALTQMEVYGVEKK